MDKERETAATGTRSDRAGCRKRTVLERLGRLGPYRYGLELQESEDGWWPKGDPEQRPRLLHLTRVEEDDPPPGKAPIHAWLLVVGRWCLTVGWARKAKR